MFRGAEPLGGVAARRRKRASRGYMVPFARVEHGLALRQRMLPPMPRQRHTLRATPSTRCYNRAIFFSLCCRIVLKLSLTAGGASVARIARRTLSGDAAIHLRR